MRYDYVIAGGGSAGCALAARLSEDPSKTVCLIDRPRINNWAFETVPQQGLGGRKGYQPSGGRGAHSGAVLLFFLI
ncbi:GMC family oxidoreductase N-terminal domain-containing protein [Mesorhizobium sp. CO1-1-8]|nr:GMC family oxidoreductase N-terminal domain-containing protein [Mesorhizobium sp. CO1-1-8]MBZ9776140.1 GMC family oxidoreductase N-terminal domain-containing protein [Mesorhizobium sp. CO1-1-8]